MEATYSQIEEMANDIRSSTNGKTYVLVGYKDLAAASKNEKTYAIMHVESNCEPVFLSPDKAYLQLHEIQEALNSFE